MVNDGCFLNLLQMLGVGISMSVVGHIVVLFMIFLCSGPELIILFHAQLS